MSNLAERLREARKRIPGMTQAKAASALGIDGQSVSDWERSRTRPDQERLPKIAELYSVNLLWLIQGKGPMLSVDPANEFVNRPHDFGVTIDPVTPAGEIGMSPELVGIFEHLSERGREELLAEARRLLAKEVLAGNPLIGGRRA